MDQLLNAINRVCTQISHRIRFDGEYFSVVFATNIRKNLNGIDDCVFVVWFSMLLISKWKI